MGYVDVCLQKKKGRFWRGEAGAGYLPSCWWTAVVVVWCGVVWCSTVVLILGSACEEIDRGWAHWESGVRCVGGQGLDGRGAPMGADWATIHD